MFVSVYSAKFLKDLKKCEKRGWDLQKLKTVICDLQSGKPLDPKHKAHPLQGKYKEYMECHIEFDWLLIYPVNRKKKTVHMV
ncbi:MAG: type II toxin-antitoxin system YafQ family toxin, partial [Methanomassiliicoccaceae archaeon]|nr:type II toxin-antitoxin system YafQ family toxin [Methanomassiliicoccaceae archaeon]